MGVFHPFIGRKIVYNNCQTSEMYFLMGTVHYYTLAFSLSCTEMIEFRDRLLFNDMLFINHGKRYQTFSVLQKTGRKSIFEHVYNGLMYLYQAFIYNI